VANLGNDDIHAALRRQAKLRGESVAHFRTPQELERRRQLLEKDLRASSRRASTRRTPFPSTEEMLREDRGR